MENKIDLNEFEKQQEANATFDAERFAEYVERQARIKQAEFKERCKFIELLREEYNYVMELKRDHVHADGLLTLGARCGRNEIDIKLLSIPREEFDRLKAEGNL